MSKTPTLIDKTGMGGVIALDGFDYQRWDAICRIPGWLLNPTFEGLTIEALEDFEARFFSPHSVHGHVLERFQAKSGALTRGSIVGVFEDFQRYDARYSGTTLMQTLVTPTLPSALQWIETNAGRIERARRFYQPFTGIISANDDAYRSKLEEAFPGSLGTFVANGANISLRNFTDYSSASSVFANALNTAFQESDFGMRSISALFDQLNHVFSNASGAMVDRQSLIEVLGSVLSSELLVKTSQPVRILSDAVHDVSDHIEIDARPFSGGPVAYPAPEMWGSDLAGPLEKTANWLRTMGHSRVTLSGRYRLSTGFAVGAAFRAAFGFEVEIPTRDGFWNTDTHPVPRASYPEWTIEPSTQLVGDRLVVSIGVLRDPTSQVAKQFAIDETSQILRIFLSQALTSGEDAQASVLDIKSAVSAACVGLDARSIDLFFVGPAALAVALGHRWNGMAPTQFFEFVSGQGTYVPTIEVA